jgi:hypothetical protein
LDEHPLHCYHWGGSGARAGYSGAPVYRHFDCASDSTFQRPRLIGIVIGGVPNVPPLDSANAITKRITERNEVQIFPAKWIYHFMKLFQLVKAPELQINPMYNEIKNNPIDPFGKIFMRCEVPHPNKETLFDQTSVFRRPHISQKKPAVTNFPLSAFSGNSFYFLENPKFR